jgi:hypothetical protein
MARLGERATPWVMSLERRLRVIPEVYGRRLMRSNTIEDGY